MDTVADNWYFDDTRVSDLALLACAAFAERQQQPPVVPQDKNIKEDMKSDVVTDDIGTLAQSDPRDLKCRFLDRLAEVFAREKQPFNLVSCTALVEGSDELSIFVTRNKPFSEMDEVFKRELGASLERLSKGGTREEAADRLWHSLVEYYYERIRFHAREFQDFVQLKIPLASPDLLGERGLLERLKQLSLLAKGLIDGQRSLASLIVEEAYSMAREPGIRACLADIVLPERIDRLILLLGFLGRLKAAHQTFLQITALIPSFAKVNIIFVKSPEAASRIHRSLEHRARALENSLRYYKKVVPGWISQQKSPKFQVFRFEGSKSLNVHAEIQMLFFLLQRPKSKLSPISYLGVSKKTCFLCGHILSKTGGFETRSNHGKIYPQWTLPKCASLDEKDLSSIETTVKALPKVLAEIVGSSSRSKGDMIKESVGDPSTEAGLSIPSDLPANYRNRQAREQHAKWIERISLETNGPEVHEEVGSCTGLDENDVSSDAARPAFRLCDCCGEQAGTIECSSCRSALYCSDSCRCDHSWRHKFNCNGFQGSLTSADYLRLDCIEDRIPTDPTVLEDFGYSTLSHSGDHSDLLGLYQGLFVNLGVASDEVHDWQVKGTLRQEITKHYEVLPKESRGGYYPWILNHECLFPPNSPSRLPRREQLARTLATCRDILATEDKDLAPQDLKPVAKQQAFFFYALMSKGWHPAPGLTTWISLGFCTAQYSGESQIAEMYRLLIKKCTFREFWQAMEDSEIVALIRKYGFSEHYKTFRNFEGHMDGLRHGNASVWDLKEFCQTEEHVPLGSVVLDYGFYKCRSNGDRTALKAVYSRFFDQGTDEMELHRACLLNEIPEHVQKTQQLNSHLQSLMRNPYPLTNHEGLVFGGVKTPLLCPGSVSGTHSKRPANHRHP